MSPPARAVHLSSIPGASLSTCGRRNLPVTDDMADVSCRTCAKIHRAAEKWRASRRRDFFAADEWTSLRNHIRQERATQDRLGADHAEDGHDMQSDRAYGRVEAYDEMLAAMDRMEG